MDLHDITEEETRKYAGIIALYENRMKIEDAILSVGEMRYLKSLSNYLSQTRKEDNPETSRLLEIIHGLIGTSAIRRDRLDEYAGDNEFDLLLSELRQNPRPERENEIRSRLEELQSNNCHV